MRSDQAKQIHLRDLLAALGCQPVKEQKGELWYMSPFRRETDASFKITRDGKAWYDHGMGQGGNILDFAMHHYRTDLRGALSELDALHIARTVKVGDPAAQLAFLDTSPPPVEARTAPRAASGRGDSEMEVTRIQPLQNRALVAYLKKRGIDAEIAKPYIQEIYYSQKGNPYFALAFGNESDGYELRNPYFKGAIGSKDITVIRAGEGEVPSVAVFEGFMDFLSALMIADRPPAMDCIILNSVAMRDRAVDAIRRMNVDTVHLYLDRDERGQALTAEMQAQLPGLTVTDESGLYNGYKDVNEYLTARNQSAAWAR